ncbi:hypothetical protein ACFTSF_37265 [Kribbella sp. NPDC056951]|uniref:hypothetical protein n=1 Tax=Kribbella sp. NPDC056951 TaxID=3345978 RepID=UPI0036304B55
MSTISRSGASTPEDVLAEVRRLLGERRSPEEFVRAIRRLLDPLAKRQVVELTERGWPVLRAAAAGRPPVDELRWCDLTSGQRVHHFEYGAGTVDSSGPDWIYITWDNPDEHLNHHTAAIVRHLTRGSPAVPTDV